MRLFEFEEASTAYHVTYAKNVKSIQQHGLIPQIGSASAEYGEEENRIYLFPSKEDATEAVMNWLGDFYDEDEPLALLEIDLTSIPIKKSVEWEYYTDSKIPPDRIKVVTLDF